MRRLRVLSVLLIVCLACGSAGAAETLRLGVFAYRPKAILQERYRPLVDYLTAQLKGPVVELQVLTQAEIEDSLDRGSLDLVLTNPSHYLVLRSRSRLTGALATLISLESGQATATLGGVIITRGDRQDINVLADLKGRHIAVPGRKYLGGFQTQAFELLQAGIRVPESVRLEVLGNHDAVVRAILAGQAEAGFIRTGVIEEMTAEGKLDPLQLRVVNPQTVAGFPYRLSTRLYPEWPFVALPHVDSRLVRRIAAALMALEQDHPAAQSIGIAGFAPPGDYLPVENLARALRLPPFEEGETITWRDLWAQHRLTITVALALLTVVAGLVLLVVTRNRELNAANHALERYRLALSAIRDGLWDWDLTTNQVYADARFYEMLGYLPDAFAVTFEEWRRRIHPDDIATAEATVMGQLQSGQGFTTEFRFRTADGGWLWLEGRGRVVQWLDGKPVRMVGTHSDISARKQVEQALQRSNAELEQFAFAVSHDLRQPLRMIATYITLLEREFGDRLEGEAREYLDFVLSGAKRMDAMLMSLLEYSRVGRRGEPMAVMDSRRAAEEALMFLGPMINEAGATVHLAGTWPRLLASGDELTRLFQNLIGNAVKYRAAGQPPEITVSAEPCDGGWMFCVCDNGIGINPEHFGQLFKVFQRLHTYDEYHGTGVGLAMCRKIVERHGGRIWVESAGEGHGSRFCFTLPAVDGAT